MLTLTNTSCAAQELPQALEQVVAAMDASMAAFDSLVAWSEAVGPVATTTAAGLRNEFVSLGDPVSPALSVSTAPGAASGTPRSEQVTEASRAGSEAHGNAAAAEAHARALGEAASARPLPSLDSAVSFSNLVKQTFCGNARVYRDFHTILRVRARMPRRMPRHLPAVPNSDSAWRCPVTQLFAEHKLIIDDVMDSAAVLFKVCRRTLAAEPPAMLTGWLAGWQDHPHLLAGFDMFLPAGYSMRKYLEVRPRGRCRAPTLTRTPTRCQHPASRRLGAAPAPSTAQPAVAERGVQPPAPVGSAGAGAGAADAKGAGVAAPDAIAPRAAAVTGTDTEAPAPSGGLGLVRCALRLLVIETRGSDDTRAVVGGCALLPARRQGAHPRLPTPAAAAHTATQARFSPLVYNEMLYTILSACHRMPHQQRPTPRVVLMHVTKLLRGHPDLIERFRAFLPPNQLNDPLPPSSVLTSVSSRPLPNVLDHASLSDGVGGSSIGAALSSGEAAAAHSAPGGGDVVIAQ